MAGMLHEVHENLQSNTLDFLRRLVGDAPSLLHEQENVETQFDNLDDMKAEGMLMT